MGSLLIVFNSSWTASGGPAVFNESFSAAGLTMNGTATAGAGSTIDCSLTVVLTGYSDSASGYSISGTLAVTGVQDTNGNLLSLASSSSGLTFTGGSATSARWNVDIAASPSPAFSGTVVVNGTTFDASTLSFETMLDVNSAALAAGRGVAAVTTASSSWASTGGNGVSYSTAGLRMTGTRVAAGSTTDVLTIAFSNYYDSTSGYTINGSLTYNSVQGTSFSETVTASDMVLSGGPITGFSCNFTSATGAKDTGTLSGNGITVDAKVFEISL